MGMSMTRERETTRPDGRGATRGASAHRGLGSPVNDILPFPNGGGLGSEPQSRGAGARAPLKSDTGDVWYSGRTRSIRAVIRACPVFSWKLAGRQLAFTLYRHLLFFPAQGGLENPEMFGSLEGSKALFCLE